MEKRIVVSLLTIAAFVLSQKGGKILGIFEWYAALDFPVKRFFYKILWYIAFPLLVMGLFHGFRKIADEAGLASRAAQGIGTGFVGTLPMLLGAGLLVFFVAELEKFVIRRSPMAARLVHA